MSKISTYEIVPIPQLADKLIGTKVGGPIKDVTYNFTLQQLLNLFIEYFPSNNLQGLLDNGNTATEDINLFGKITTTDIDVTGTANLFNTYLVNEVYLQGKLFDSLNSFGTLGQILSSTGDGVAWITPSIEIPTLQQVLNSGNVSDIDVILQSNLEVVGIDSDIVDVYSNLLLHGLLTDGFGSIGANGQVLSSNGANVKWVDLPSYSALSPLLFNPATGAFSIQQANGVQSGYLSYADWINFDGKQNAGNYITALTGEATASGPGSVPIVLSNAAILSKVLSGLNIVGGSIVAADNIITAFGKLQNQINALIGGVQYQGTWNASINFPILVSSVGTQGHYYVVNVAGSTNLNGVTDWKVGDWAIFNGGTWQKVDNTDAVTSVNGFTGAVNLITDNISEGVSNLYFTNNRSRAAISLTTTGISGVATYDNITGVINIPDYSNGSTGLVPYIGANQNVNLGEFGLDAGYIQFDTTPAGVGAVGRLIWNNQDGTLDLGLIGGNVTLQLGQEQLARVVNGTGSNLLESQYRVVKIIGAQGQRLQVGLAQADTEANSTETLGVVTENINNNEEGFITTSGLVRKINTTGSLQGESWSDGDVLYLSGTVAGGITNIKPVAPINTVILGFVVYAHNVNGSIYVKVDNGYELNELHDVLPTPYVNKGVLYRDTATNLWRSATIETLLGYTPANGNIYTTDGTVGSNRILTLNNKYVSFTKTYNYVFGDVPMALQSYTTATYNGGAMQGGPHYGAGESIYTSIFTASTNVPNSLIDSAHHLIRSMKLTTAGSTVSYGQAFGIRAAATLTSQVIIDSSTASGTVSHMANIQVMAPYSSGFTGLTVSNYYGFVLNDSTEYTSGGQFNITNRWGIYQAGYNDKNYFAAKVLLNTTVDAGYQLDVNGTGRFINALTAGSFVKTGGTSSQFLKADGSVDTNTYTPTSRTLTINGTTQDLSANRTFTITPTESIMVAASDETTALTTGTAKVTFRMPYAFTITGIRLSATTAPTGAALIADIRESGVSLFSTLPRIDAGSTTSVGSSTPYVITDTALANNAVITIDITQVGSTVAGTGLKVYIIGYQ